MLCAIEKFSPEEVGELLDISKMDVRARAARAQHLLCRSLSREVNQIQDEAFGSDVERSDRIIRNVLSRLDPDGGKP